MVDDDPRCAGKRDGSDFAVAVKEPEMTEPTLLVYTTYRIQPGDVEPFRTLALRMAGTARLRDGCAFLDVAEDTEATGTFRLIEGWRDQAALDAHASSAEFQAVLQEAGTLGIIERKIDVYTVAGRITPDLLS